jgi:hypothetical protein
MEWSETDNFAQIFGDRIISVTAKLDTGMLRRTRTSLFDGAIRRRDSRRPRYEMFLAAISGMPGAPLLVHPETDRGSPSRGSL